MILAVAAAINESAKKEEKKLDEDLKIYGLGYRFVHSWTDGASPLAPMM